jgi:hypothetical protein
MAVSKTVIYVVYCENPMYLCGKKKHIITEEKFTFAPPNPQGNPAKAGLEMLHLIYSPF